MSNTSNIKSRSYPDQTKLELITSLQFDEPHSSLALNRNIHGLVPHGIYQGFDVSLAGGMDLLIGGTNFGAAVAKHADVSLTIHQQGNKTVTLAAGERQYVVIDSFFQYGVRTKQVDVLASKHAAEYKVVKTPELLPHHVVIACVDVPTGSTQLEDSMIMRSERSIGGWGIADHINQYDPHPQYLQKSHAAVEAEIDAKSPSLLKYINLSMLWRALAKLLGDSKAYTDTEVQASYTKVIGEAKAFTIKKHDEQQVHFEGEHNTAISYTDTKLTEAKAFATQKHNEQQAYVNTEVGKVHTFAQNLHDTQQNYINQQVAAVVGANVPDDLNSIRELIAEIQSNETAINVMRNIQAKKLDKTATAANSLLFGGKTYDQAKSEFRSGLITSQRAVSDSVTSNSSVIAASLKGLNTTYKKAVSAYDLAASKMSQAVADARYLKKTDSAPKLGGQIPDYYLSGSSKEYVDIIVSGDANKYYPVSISQNNANGHAWGHYGISRMFNWHAPSSWHNSSHKGGLTLDIEWSGDTSWGGNNHNIRVPEFDETYSTMVGGIGLSKTKGLIIWLRGGGATYRVTTPRGKEESPTIHHGGLVDSGDSFPVKDYDAAFVKQTVTDRQPVRNHGELFDRGERVYSPNNKPTAADVGAYSQAESDSNFLPAIAPRLTGDIDLNDYVKTGNYNVYQTATMKNRPPAGCDYGTLQVLGSNSSSFSFVTQTFIDRISGNMAFRGRNDGAANWSPWRMIYNEAHKPTAADVGAAAAIPTVEMWIGAAIPSTHTELDGKRFDKNRYPQLAKLFPNGILKDTRGMTLKHAPNGRAVGSFEAEAVKSHNHSASASSHSHVMSHNHPRAWTNTNTHNHQTGNLPYRAGAGWGHMTPAWGGDNVQERGHANLTVSNSSHNHFVDIPHHHGHTGASAPSVSVHHSGASKNLVDNIAVKYIIRLC